MEWLLNKTQSEIEITTVVIEGMAIDDLKRKFRYFFLFPLFSLLITYKSYF